MPDADEAETVRMVLELAARYETNGAIARTLNEKGLARRNGKGWTRRQVRAPLRRQNLYRDGVVRYGQATGANEKLVLVKDESE